MMFEYYNFSETNFDSGRNARYIEQFWGHSQQLMTFRTGLILFDNFDSSNFLIFDDT